MSEAAFIGPALLSNGWGPRTGRRSGPMASSLIQKLYIIDHSLQMKKMFSTSKSYRRNKEPHAQQQKTNSTAPMDFLCLIHCVKPLLFVLTAFQEIFITYNCVVSLFFHFFNNWIPLYVNVCVSLWMNVFLGGFFRLFFLQALFLFVLFYSDQFVFVLYYIICYYPLFYFCIF